MIDFLLVDKKKAVVAAGDDFDLDGRVLGVVFVEIECELPADFLRVDGCGYSGPPLGKHEQDGFIHVIVHEDEGGLRLLDERGGKCVGVENLAVVENALARRLVGLALERIEDLVEFLIGVGDVPELAHFDMLHFLDQMRVVEEESAHFNKGLDDADAHLHSRLTVQYGGKHGHSLLCKDMREVFAVLPTSRGI